MALVVALASQQRPAGHGVGRHEAGTRQHHAEECLGLSLSSGYHYRFLSKYLNSLEPSCCHENCWSISGASGTVCTALYPGCRRLGRAAVRRHNIRWVKHLVLSGSMQKRISWETMAPVTPLTILILSTPNPRYNNVTERSMICWDVECVCGHYKHEYPSKTFTASSYRRTERWMQSPHAAGAPSRVSGTYHLGWSIHFKFEVKCFVSSHHLQQITRLQTGLSR